MKSVLAVLAFGVGVAHAAVQGFDISHYQGTVNFQSAYSDGARFVIIKVQKCLPQDDLKAIIYA
jgi:GH25 family lysozyme M1 (1,4-beta-N-acetylmuramidase)